MPSHERNGRGAISMQNRDQVRELLKEDAIRFIVVQFVDLHGTAKAKMVPVECFDDVIDVGAGFAGGALWGVGQGPHSHDLMARIDVSTYTPLSWMPGTARFAAEMYVDDKANPSFCPP